MTDGGWGGGNTLVCIEGVGLGMGAKWNTKSLGPFPQRAVVCQVCEGLLVATGGWHSSWWQRRGAVCVVGGHVGGVAGNMVDTGAS